MQIIDSAKAEIKKDITATKRFGKLVLEIAYHAILFIMCCSATPSFLGLFTLSHFPPLVVFWGILFFLAMPFGFYQGICVINLVKEYKNEKPAGKGS